MKSLFIHIPKNAGNTIIRALAITPYRPDREYDDPDPDRITYRHTFFHELPAAAQARPFKFTFVRNPYDRAVSSWAYGSKRRKDIAAYLLSNRGRTGNKGIFGKQALWFKGVDFDFVGRFERLEEDLRYLAGRLGVHLNYIPHLNASNRPGDDYNNKELKEVVRKLYREDFSLLGYPL